MNTDYNIGSLAIFINDKCSGKIRYPKVKQIMPKINYQEYIRSAGWYSTRDAKLFDANYKCEKCGRDDLKLDVHHLTYERLGNERMSDLRVLCRYCHKVEHGIITFPEVNSNTTDPF